MSTELETLIKKAETAVNQAADLRALDEIRVEYLGKTGVITDQLKQLGKLPAEERKTAGAEINKAKQMLQAAIEGRKTVLETAALAERLAAEKIDVSLPGRGEANGGLHPVTRTMQRIQQIFGVQVLKLRQVLRSKTTFITLKR